jgi:hypothetical protein
MISESCSLLPEHIGYLTRPYFNLKLPGPGVDEFRGVGRILCKRKGIDRFDGQYRGLEDSHGRFALVPVPSQNGKEPNSCGFKGAPSRLVP